MENKGFLGTSPKTENMMTRKKNKRLGGEKSGPVPIRSSRIWREGI